MREMSLGNAHIVTSTCIFLQILNLCSCKCSQ
uniref:Uncharacterized protein n=1 Tax=Setaria viridis TaxID=4556 RepID=A0A4U6TI14_SETVI|nr:hypothetical protein SEVIR_8G134850v2 [Setaria viridis]